MEEKKFSFPMLKYQDIEDCLAEMDVRVTREQLQNPTSQVCKDIMELFVQKLVGVQREDLRQVDFGALDVLRFPEVHEQSIVEATLTRSM